jgi:hypothetical protein
MKYLEEGRNYPTMNSSSSNTQRGTSGGSPLNGRPKVYVVNKGCHDYSKAEKFGTLVYLTEGRFSRFATGKMYRVFHEKISKSSSNDYILVSGLTIMNSVVCSMFARKHGRVNLLLFNAGPNKRDDYVTRTVVMEDL